MDLSEILAAADLMSIEDRIRLAEAIRDEIEADHRMPELTEAQKQELDRRIAAYEASPESWVSGEQVEAEARARLRR